MTMLAATGPLVAGSPKGVCQAGGVNAAVLETAQLQYWQWNFGIGRREADSNGDSSGDPIPPRVDRDLRGYLGCGVLACGFARACFDTWPTRRGV